MTGEAAGPLILVDLQSATPPFEQVRAQLAGHIVGAALPDGARLPPIRTVAADLGLASNTVARAYRELEREGLVRTRRRTGTVVTRPVVPGDASLYQLAARYATAATAAGWSDTEALDVVRAALGSPSRGPAAPSPVSRRHVGLVSP